MSRSLAVMRREAVEVGRQGIPDLVLVVALEVPAKQLLEQRVVAVALGAVFLLQGLDVAWGEQS